MDYKVTAPVKSYTGYSAGIFFMDGIGTAKDGRNVEWFLEHGYTVEPIGEEKCRKAKKQGGADDSTGDSTEKA